MLHDSTTSPSGDFRWSQMPAKQIGAPMLVVGKGPYCGDLLRWGDVVPQFNPQQLGKTEDAGEDLRR